MPRSAATPKPKTKPNSKTNDSQPVGPNSVDIVPEREWADIANADLRTVRRWDANGEGPPSFKLGRKTFYRRSTILSHIEKLEQQRSR